MFGRKQPRWLKNNGYLINLDHVEFFAQTKKGKTVARIRERFIFLHGVTLDDITYFLKHGKPRKKREGK